MSVDVKKRTARLDWSLWVECPKCGEDNDLASGDHDADYHIALAIFNDKWDDLRGYEVVCGKCDYEFEIASIEY